MSQTKIEMNYIRGQKGKKDIATVKVIGATGGEMLLMLEAYIKQLTITMLKSGVPKPIIRKCLNDIVDDAVNSVIQKC